MADFLSETDFELYRKLIYDESGIHFSATNRSILESRLRERLREKKLQTPAEYYAILIRDREELKLLLDSVTTNLTRFFRNQAHFDAIEHFVVPELLKLRASERKLRFWSAGCSTGEEPYTIAMLLKHILPVGWNYEVTASDISLKSLMVGKEGFYPETRVQGIPDEYLAKYFEKRPNGYQIKDEIKKTIRFDYHNLKNDSGQRGLDVVFCRNVLIYFDTETRRKVVQAFSERLREGGYLLLGHSENLFSLTTKFELVQLSGDLVYRKPRVD